MFKILCFKKSVCHTESLVNFFGDLINLTLLEVIKFKNSFKANGRVARKSFDFLMKYKDLFTVPLKKYALDV